MMLGESIEIGKELSILENGVNVGVRTLIKRKVRMIEGVRCMFTMWEEERNNDYFFVVRVEAEKEIGIGEEERFYSSEDAEYVFAESMGY